MTRGKKVYTTVVADSHNLFRRGLATLISAESDLEVTAEAASAEQALAILTAPEGISSDQFQPIDILVMEIGMVHADPQIIKALRQLPQTTAVLFLAPQESPDWLETTVSAGARGYMIKTTPPVQLIAGIRKAIAHDDRDPNRLSGHAPDLKALAETEQSYSRTSPLTAREQEVTMLLAEGRTVREVAVELSLSIKTIEAHKLNLMRKLDIHNRASLVDYALKSGLVSAKPVLR
jgi:DNA-binding NarL/FixJ family response regulator